jgi:hypothetical protein
MFYIELVWNREFHWTQYGSGYPTKDQAIAKAKALLNMGDGASIKKARIVDEDRKVVVPYVSC